ncbi:hypothetical protein EIP91_009380 [Steccherinum ochraceum]|uniref:Uncharacterized protein n=1 Tax=Steccherinum ochraceum TaxID=92696 RepID=A0A4R0REL3_9APHY|nr:hypothetical protein EIP91_009380 [Steccherinum ochraceum]
MRITTLSTVLLAVAASSVVALPVPVHRFGARRYDHENAIMPRDHDLLVREVLQALYGRELAHEAHDSVSIKSLYSRAPPAGDLRRVPGSSNLRGDAGPVAGAGGEEHPGGQAPAEHAGPSGTQAPAEHTPPAGGSAPADGPPAGTGIRRVPASSDLRGAANSAGPSSGPAEHAEPGPSGSAPAAHAEAGPSAPPPPETPGPPEVNMARKPTLGPGSPPPPDVNMARKPTLH